MSSLPPPMALSHNTSEKTYRVLINGCWDLLHTGHLNALRQVACLAAQDGSKVVAGIHPNCEIARVKGGAFVSSEEEKEAMLRACKWVDDVAHGVPYEPVFPSLLDRPDVRCDLAVHGDDPVILKDGTDMYGGVRKAGRCMINLWGCRRGGVFHRYKEVRRSECISTTTLISRILCAAKKSGVSQNEPVFGEGSFSMTARRTMEFAHPVRKLEDAQEIIYIDGDWDLLHPAHAFILEHLSNLSRSADSYPFVLVGIHSAEDVRKYRGTEVAFPILSDGERALSLLAMRFVSDVVLQAPVNPSLDFFRAFGVTKIARVKNHPDFLFSPTRFDNFMREGIEVVEVDFPALCPSYFISTAALIKRVVDSRPEFEERNAKKKNPPMKPVQAKDLTA